VLEVKGLRVHYGTVEAVKGVSFEISERAIVSLIGANGAGKTTCLRALTGLVKPSGGEVRFENTSLVGLAPHQIVRLGIAHVPEGRRLFPKMTVLENLRMGAYLRTKRTEMASTLGMIYEHFPILRERGRQRAGSLSGGEQQMLAIARALMNRPRLLLLDEPSMGLSPIMTAEIGKVIRQINAQDVSIILVEQNALLALTLARYGYVLETGLVVMQGNARELLRDEGVKKAYLGILSARVEG
jgi:branched-chain amino acid transport system ATP-binding protein